GRGDASADDVGPRRAPSRDIDVARDVARDVPGHHAGLVDGEHNLAPVRARVGDGELDRWLAKVRAARHARTGRDLARVRDLDGLHRLQVFIGQNAVEGGRRKLDRARAGGT